MSPSAWIWLACMVFSLLVVGGQADLMIDVGITASCQTDTPIGAGVAQTFKMSSLLVLDRVDFWIKPDISFGSSYSAELWIQPDVNSSSSSHIGAELLDYDSFKSLGFSSILPLPSSAAPAWYSFVIHPFGQPQDLIILKPDYTYALKLFAESPYSGTFSFCSDLYSDGSFFSILAYGDEPAVFPLNDMTFRLYATPFQLAYWSFNGTFEDTSPHKLGRAIAVGSNVTLLDDYVTIRFPGYLNVPRVDIHDKSFIVAFNIRIPTSGVTGKRYLYADWSNGQWQFLSQIDAANTVSVQLRRNIETNGKNSEQDLVSVTSSITVPSGVWFDVAWGFDRPGRTLKLYFDQQMVGSATVRSSVTDVTLKDSNSTYYQFGRKNDEATNLDVDLRHLRVYATTNVTLTTL